MGTGDTQWPEHCEDEYDGYLKKAVGLAGSGAEAAKIADYFCKISSEYMGLGADRQAALVTAQAIVDYVAKLDLRSNRCP